MIEIIKQAAIRTGSRLVKDIITAQLGSTVGGLAGAVVDNIAKQLGVAPIDIPTVPPEDLDSAVRRVNDDPEIMRLWVEQQRMTNELLTQEISAEPAWTWAWRPAWMWFLMLLWAIALVIFPLLSVALRTPLPPLDLTTLTYLTGAYLALYMGGHTAKSILGDSNR